MHIIKVNGGPEPSVIFVAYLPGKAAAPALAMAGAINRQPFQVFVENLARNGFANEATAVALFRIVPGDQTHPLRARDTQIDFAHGANEGFVDRRGPNLGAARVSPNHT